MLGRIDIDMSTGYGLFNIHTSETRTSGAFTVTRTSTNTCNTITIKNLVKIVKYLEFLAKVYSNIAGNVVRSCLRQNYFISSLCPV